MTEIQIVLNDAAEVVMPALHDFDVKSLKIIDKSLILLLKDRDKEFVVKFVGVEQMVVCGFCQQNIILDLLLLSHKNCSVEELIQSSQRLGLKCDLDSETMHKYKNGDLVYSILYSSVGLDLQVLSKEVHVYQN
ncbi:hypothetical protein D0436_15680 [Shewanella decolorationis]|uniref:Uncharacterized protein n=1 Tax=Shewanella decolorationis TaxID=256839 RepID=A0A5B8QYL2_9GAMM|nr:hypothetical protein [Shewanella decolorationis]QDZ91783.1 hypothetical protein D0436_15680 [Shewanella decolorationis]